MHVRATGIMLVVMSEVTVIGGFLAVWLLLQFWLLPRLGVPT